MVRGTCHGLPEIGLTQADVSGLQRTKRNGAKLREIEGLDEKTSDVAMLANCH
jgi:predicted transcriptional regulator